MKGVSIFPEKKRLLLSALALGLAAGTLCADSGKEKRRITEPTSTVEGYFVRVKSGLSGEKELYYNKDGTLRDALGGGLLGGEFSLDESLLGGDDSDAGLTLGPPPAFPQPARTEPGEGAAPAVPASTGATGPVPVPAAGKTPAGGGVPAPAPAPRPAPEAPDEGVVDVDAALKNFSREKRPGAFGVTAENFRNVLNTTVNERFSTPFEAREWPGATSSFGLLRYDSAAENFDMGGSGWTSGNARFDAGLFDATASAAGERMFLRDPDGLLEVRLNERFSATGRVFANEQTRSLRESSGFSMQDINRYQFRRNRSSEPGLPVVSPSSGENVRRENFSSEAGGVPAR